MSEENKNLTLEELIQRAGRSQAASPEYAIALVRHLSQLSGVCAFCGEKDVGLLAGFAEDIFEDEDKFDVDTYQHFCPFYETLLAKDNKRTTLELRPEDIDPYKPMWGVRMNNAMVLLCESMLDQAKGRRPYKDVYHCLHQTLGQYLNALEDPMFQRSLTEAEGFQMWKNCLLRDTDPNLSMADALVSILRRYIAAFQTLDRMDHILTCLGGLALHLEILGTDYDLQPDEEGISQMVLHISRNQYGEAAFQLRQALRRYGIGRDHMDLPRTDLEEEDPCAYFLNLAKEYASNLPDPGEDMELHGLREQIFLPDRAYGTESLQMLAEQSSTEGFRNLLEEYFTGDTLAQAMRGINGTVTDIYMLFVEPFLHMEEPTETADSTD